MNTFKEVLHKVADAAQDAKGLSPEEENDYWAFFFNEHRIESLKSALEFVKEWLIEEHFQDAPVLELVEKALEW